MRIAAGDQRSTRGGAHGGSGIVLGEAEPFAHELVERWCTRNAAVEASEIAVAHVVGENENYVGTIRRGGSPRARCHRNSNDPAGHSSRLLTRPSIIDCATSILTRRATRIVRYNCPVTDSSTDMMRAPSDIGAMSP